jgi:ribonuclease HI
MSIEQEYEDIQEKYILFFDGLQTVAGAVLYRNDSNETEPTKIWNYSVHVGSDKTNNYAEYMGLIEGLVEARRKCLPNLLVKGTSLQVIEQMQGIYQVDDPQLLPLYQRACFLANRIGYVEFQHVDASNNKQSIITANDEFISN